MILRDVIESRYRRRAHVKPTARLELPRCYIRVFANFYVGECAKCSSRARTRSQVLVNRESREPESIVRIVERARETTAADLSVVGTFFAAVSGSEANGREDSVR